MGYGGLVFAALPRSSASSFNRPAGGRYSRPVGIDDPGDLSLFAWAPFGA